MDFREELAEQVRAAFADTVRPDWEYFVAYETQDLEKLDWHEVSLELLLWHRHDLPVFDLKPLIYFLPAFLIASILHHEETDDLSDRLLDSLSNGKAWSWLHEDPELDKWRDNRIDQIANALSTVQKQAVAAYFQHYRQLVGEEYWKWLDEIGNTETAAMLDAASVYWTRIAE